MKKRKWFQQIMAVLAAVWAMGIAVPAQVYAADGEIVKEYQKASREQEKRETGAFKLTLVDGEEKDKRLSGGIFAVYKRAGGEKVSELMTGEAGSIQMLLPEGDYILQETVAPEGYLLSEERITVSIRQGEEWSFVFINEKEALESKSARQAEEKTGILQILNAGAGTGEKLSGGVFYIYDSAGKKREEVTLSAGEASLRLDAGNYYLKEIEAPGGYLVEEARIGFCIQEGELTLAEITSERDIHYLEGKNPKEIIPKTGEIFPVWRYLVVMVCTSAAVWSGFHLWQLKRRRDRRLCS